MPTALVAWLYREASRSMQLVLLVVHMLIAAVLVGVVLVQKSEGGALGIGGGGGGFLTGRGSANLLTRTTAILAAAFFVTSLSLTLLAQRSAPVGSILDKPTATQTAPATPTTPTSAPSGEATKPVEGATDAKPSDTKPAGRGGILDKLDPQSSPIPR